MEVPLAQGPEVLHMDLDIVLEEVYEALSRGRPVAEQKCPYCHIPLPYVASCHPGRFRQETLATCAMCGTTVTYLGFHSPLGWFGP